MLCFISSYVLTTRQPNTKLDWLEFSQQLFYYQNMMMVQTYFKELQEKSTIFKYTTFDEFLKDIPNGGIISHIDLEDYFEYLKIAQG